MNDNKLYLNLEFSTPNSLIFSVNNAPVSSEIHIHMGIFQVMRITVIISDNRTVKKTIKSFSYLNDLMSELQEKLYNITGLFNKGQEIELYLSINYNNRRINMAPYILFTEKHGNICAGDWSSYIFETLKKYK